MSGSAPGRVLVIDDEQNITESVQTALERVGYVVDVAPDPVTAWNKLEQSMPNVDRKSVV